MRISPRIWIGKAAQSLEIAANRTSRWLHSVSGGMLPVMMFITFADVCLRYSFNRPITGSNEVITYMMAILVAFGIAYCAVHKSHVKVDLILARLPQNLRVIIESITSLASLGFFSIVTWQCALYVIETYASGVTGAVLLIPVFPFVAAVALGSAIFCLVLLSDFLDFLSRAVRK